LRGFSVQLRDTVGSALPRIVVGIDCDHLFQVLPLLARIINSGSEPEECNLVLRVCVDGLQQQGFGLPFVTGFECGYTLACQVIIRHTCFSNYFFAENNNKSGEL
jgi:hypothetical protein